MRDPFHYHREKVIVALSEGVAAAYGYDIARDIAEFGTMTGETAAGFARAMAGCDRFLGYAEALAGRPARQLHLFDSFAGLPAADNAVDLASPHVRQGVWSAGTCIGISADQLAEKLAPSSSPNGYASFVAGSAIRYRNFQRRHATH